MRGGPDMKISVDVECTPEEARRFMGLPDMSPVHDIFLDKLKQTAQEGITPEVVERLVRSWSPMGEASVNMWRQMFDQVSGTKS